ncbi:SDR family NAD(P)-dependent oxidoreductase [Myxococcota bacterium]|nr:SDR family NAD(P)-dependent oxidoreductase [Myxococcota bacterium]
MKRVAIFGATSAVAAAAAERWAARGDRLFLAGRDAEKLAALRARLGNAAVAGDFQGDFTAPGVASAAVGAAFATFAETGPLDVALVAHGLLGEQQETERDFTAADAVLQTNFNATIALLVPLVNGLEAQGHGALGVITSVAGERGRPRNYTYGAAKAGLNTYLQGVRSRLYGRGVAVHTFKLGPVDSPMTTTHTKHALFSTPERVAPILVDRLDGPGGEHYVPGYWRPILGVVRALPEAVFQRFGFLAGR